MKKLFVSFMLLSSLLAMVSCGSANKAASSQEETAVDLVFVEEKYMSDDTHFRANQSGESRDMSIAKKIAVQNTRQELAAHVQAQVQMVVENYLRQLNVESGLRNEQDMQELAYTIVNTTLSGTRIIGEKAFKKADGVYRYHVCMELDKQSLIDSLEDKIAKDEKLVNINKAEFRKIFEEKIWEAR